MYRQQNCVLCEIHGFGKHLRVADFRWQIRPTARGYTFRPEKIDPALNVILYVNGKNVGANSLGKVRVHRLDLAQTLAQAQQLQVVRPSSRRER